MTVDRAVYTLEPKTIPLQFILPPAESGGARLEELIQLPLEEKRYNFAKELEYISQHEDRRHREAPVDTARAASGALASDTLLMMAVGDADMDAAAGTVAQSQAPPSPSAKEVEQRFKRIDEMMAATRQEREVCLFYLESSNWDVGEAVALFKNTT